MEHAKAQAHSKNSISNKDKPESSKNEWKKNKSSEKCKGSDMTVAAVKSNKSRNTRDNKGHRHGGEKWCPVHQSNQYDFNKC